MNANELADKLEKCCLVSWGECNHEDYDTDIWTKMKSATMLRQQQAEIEALKARIEYMREKASLWEAEAHAGGVEAGKKLAQAEIDLLKADMRLLLKEYHQYWKEKNDSIRG